MGTPTGIWKPIATRGPYQRLTPMGSSALQCSQNSLENSRRLGGRSRPMSPTRPESSLAGSALPRRVGGGGRCQAIGQTHTPAETPQRTRPAFAPVGPGNARRSGPRASVPRPSGAGGAPNGRRPGTGSVRNAGQLHARSGPVPVASPSMDAPRCALVAGRQLWQGDGRPARWRNGNIGQGTMSRRD